MTRPIAAARPALDVLNAGDAWSLLQALARAATRGQAVRSGPVSLDAQGETRADAHGRSAIAVDPEAEVGWAPLAAVDDPARLLLDLFVPLCCGADAEAMVVAHLGQSLDGRLATVTGSARFVTGPEDLAHMHRLRALFDAVVIGAQTACVDDPELTTRLVPGKHPVRVVLDPQGRAGEHLKLLSAAAAPTLLFGARGAKRPQRTLGAHVEQVEVASDGRKLDLRQVLAELAARGLRRVFVEGGGITVSRFLQEGLLHRLQLTIAPKIIGSGTHAFELEPIAELSDAITLRSRRFALGDDILFDCDLRA
jgi:diaminohydroxyphosphoribosylaminopyrimidine deaminase/5-amino-6-(5-phosphoribosylamino)uracil reductase